MDKMKLFSIVFNCLRKNSFAQSCVSHEKGVLFDKLGCTSAIKMKIFIFHYVFV